MIFVPNTEHNPRLNLAIETYLLKEKHFDDTVLLFYINEPSVIIGRNQNTIEEINQSYIDEHDIKVVRRLSGGGAVYHDLGNLNFSFIMPENDHFMDFKTLTQPIIDALHQLGIKNAEMSGRNDLLIDGKKFSGNAMYKTNGRMFCHGTLMFDSDLDVVTDALKVRKDKIESKGIKSVRSRVTNIKPHLPKEMQKMTTEGFEKALLHQLFHTDDLKTIPLYILTDDDWKRINEIADEYYCNWNWNYGQSPDFSIKKEHRYPFGLIEARMMVKQGKIEEIHFYGDFFGTEDTRELERRLVGVEYQRDAIVKALVGVELRDFFGPMSHDDLADLLVG